MSEVVAGKFGDAEWHVPAGSGPRIGGGDPFCTVTIMLKDGSTRYMPFAFDARDVVAVLVNDTPFKPEDCDEVWYTAGGRVVAIETMGAVYKVDARGKESEGDFEWMNIS